MTEKEGKILLFRPKKNSLGQTMANAYFDELEKIRREKARKE